MCKVTIEYSLKNVPAKAMFTLTVSEMLLSKVKSGHSLSLPAPRPAKGLIFMFLLPDEHAESTCR